MTLLIRILLYAVCVFLVMIVYCGQYETTARGTAALAVRKTGKAIAITAVAVVVMFILALL